MQTKKVRVKLENLAGKRGYREYFYYYFSEETNYFKKGDESKSAEGILEIEVISPKPIERKVKERWQKEKIPLYGMKKMNREKIKNAVSATQEEYLKNREEKTLQF